jgi:hypothetical protein
VWQRRRLDDLRPAGAEPLDPSVAPPDVDEAFDAGPAASGFDDLHGDHGEGDHSGEVAQVRVPLTPPRAGSVPVDADTPEAIVRPVLDDLPDGDVDPDALAAAMAELDAELGDGTAAGGAPTDE